MNLHRFQRGLHTVIRRVPLRHAGFARVADAPVFQPAGAHVQQISAVVPLLHKGQLLLDQLMLADGLAKGLTFVGILQARFQTGADQPGCAAGDGVAAIVQAGHGDFETFTFLTEAILNRDFHVLHRDPPGRTGAHTELAVNIAGGQAGHIVSQDKSGHAPAARFGVCFGDHQKVMGFRRQADPHFFAVEDIFVTHPAGGGGHAGDIAARARFRQAESGVFFAHCLRNQKLLLLFLRAPLQQGHTVQPHVDGHNHPQSGVGPFEFLAHQAQRDVIKTLPAVAHRDIDAENAQFRHAWQDSRIHLLSAIPFTDGGNHLFFGKIAHDLLRLNMFFTQREIHRNLKLKLAKPKFVVDYNILVGASER